MHDQYKAFLKVLRPVSRYAVDLTLAEMRAEHAEEDADKDETDDNELPSSFSIEPDEFLTSLYEDRGDLYSGLPPQTVQGLDLSRRT